ncbi:hypothetical protein BS50DRAFT_572599 [Corynespora cassiicola Philippines]|uniref:Uncharacterized protein n=1 Tax=Corynespora cassiicola Philippines TaxID=1448308 RepID=A0A2T2NVP3_CORCC|nr:hypothetical protein BS50DRAFT_572599 [Corynespora cassiicola Philippines]
MGSKTSELAEVRRFLTENPTAKWGFIIYRCTYKNDDEWARFMDNLKTRTKIQLEEDGDGDLFERMDWPVQDDNRKEFDSGGTHKCRMHFLEELLPTLPFSESTRHEAFVTVNQVNLETVLYDAAPPDKFDAFGTGFVSLVSAEENEGWMSVGVSYLVPTVYAMLKDSGWHYINPGDDDVACP